MKNDKFITRNIYVIFSVCFFWTSELWVYENGEEPLLPGLTDYNQRQLFWIRNAHRFCGYYSKNSLKRSIKDVHTPNKYRILGSMMLSDEFANDFNCSSKTFMNPPKVCPIGSLWPDSPLKGLSRKNTMNRRTASHAPMLSSQKYTEILIFIGLNYVFSYFN